jgi:GTP-binding protein
VKSGNGGAGHISFRREKFVPKGGPDGGNGGKGGDVIFKADQHLSTLLDFKYNRYYAADNGVPGGKKGCTGRDGKDTIIRIPCGTLIKDAKTEEIIVDLTENGEEFIIAKGGKGGKGNKEFTTPTNQTPRYAQPGLPGEEYDLILELKLIADVGIVGYPNVGKSTLISVISEAKPKIADYPFTTLVPNLGMVRIGDYQNYVIADIPGLIEGAAEGKGLGHQFLRHVDRCRVLLFMIDATSEDPKNDFETLMNELLMYNPEMGWKKKIVCFSKSDLIDEERSKEIQKIKFKKVTKKSILISSVMHQNTDLLKKLMWEEISKEF